MTLPESAHRVGERLHEELGVRTEDVFLGLGKLKKDQSSFGNGMVQYVERMP
jgi:hypothetical protein